MQPLTIRQQTINDRVSKTKQELGLSDSDKAFERLAHYATTGISLLDFDENDLVDGGQDKQIDIITITQESDEEATIYIIQAKNTTNDFASDVVIKMRNGLSWIFSKSPEEVAGLTNERLRDKIYEINNLFGEVTCPQELDQLE